VNELEYTIMEKSYKMIRGTIPTNRCTKVGPYGSALYCDCGCQKPHDDDPKIELGGVTVSSRANHGYADYALARNGEPCGEFNTQYCALILDGHEYLGCDRDEMNPILSQIFDGDTNRFPRDQEQAGDTLAETAATVRLSEKLALDEQDERYKNHPGYCNKCHSFCYGDCGIRA